MQTLKIAHRRVQGQDIILIPLDSSFDQKTEQSQRKALAYLQECAASAGLAGQVAVFWNSASGRTDFFGPSQWHAFLSSLTMQSVWQNINMELRCP